MYPRIWLFFAAVVSAVFTVGCGSIVQSTREDSPPARGTQMEGLAYWLPKGAVVIEGKWDKDNGDWTISVTPYIDADTSKRWRLTRKVNHLFEDNVSLEVDAKTGLLKTVNGTSEDKTAAIVAEGLAVAAKALTFGGAGAVSPTAGSKQLAPEATRAPCSESVEFEGSFRYLIKTTDPPRNEYSDICRTLNLKSPKPATSPSPAPPRVEKRYDVIVHRADKPDTGTGPKGAPIMKPVDGIVVRAPAPYLVTLKQLDAETQIERTAEQLVFLPNTRRDYYLPLDRSPFVKNDTQIMLVDGVVQKVAVTRPSIILGILGVPKTILEALIPLPH